MSDREHHLLKQYAERRDAEAFAELVARHRDMVFSVSLRIVGNREDAEDVSQMCFLQMAHKAGRLHAPVAGWLHRVATHYSVDFLRKRYSVKRTETIGAFLKAARRDPTWDEVKGVLDEAINALPKRLHEPVVLCFLEGLSQSDVAAELGVSQAAVSIRLGEAVKRLRKSLRKLGLIVPGAALTVMIASHGSQAAAPALISALGKMAIVGPGGGTGPWSLLSALRVRPLWVSGAAALLPLVIASVTVWTLVLSKLQTKRQTASSSISATTDSRVVLRTLIAGKVADGEGRGIGGAFVTVWHDPSVLEDWPSGRRAEQVLAEARAQADGRFELAVELSQAQALTPVFATFRADGYGTHDQPLTNNSLLPPVLRLKEIRLGPGVMVSGRVLDASGNPVPNLMVVCESNRSPYEAQSYWSVSQLAGARTDEQGRFILDGVNPAQPLYIQLRRPDGTLLLGTSRAYVEGVSVEVILPPLGSLDGIVLEPSGRPVPDARVYIVRAQEGWIGEARFAVTDKEGRFSVEDVIPSAYQVIARTMKAYGSIDTMEVRPRTRARCSITTRPGMDLRGLVVFRESRRPAPGVPLMLTEGTSYAGGMMVRSNDEGVFSFQGVRPGSYELLTMLSGRKKPQSISLLPSGTRLTVRVELCGRGMDGVVSGTVVDSGGEAVPNALVSVPGLPDLLSATDEGGRFALRIVGDCTSMAGLIPLTALSPDLAFYGTSGLTSGSSQRTDLSIVLDRPLIQVRGLVVDSAGRPVSGAAVTARVQTGAMDSLMLPSASAMSDDEGAFLLNPIEPYLQYRLSVCAGGYAPAEAVFGPVGEGRESVIPVALDVADGHLRGRVLRVRPTNHRLQLRKQMMAFAK